MSLHAKPWHKLRTVPALPGHCLIYWLRAVAPLLITLSLAVQAATANGQETVPAEYTRSKTFALNLILRSDSFSAIEYISTLANPEAAMSVFELVTRDLYWQKRDLTAAMAIGRAGVQYGLSTSLRHARDDQDLAYRLRSQAKGIAYDLGSFSWPGWDEEGITISESNLVFGQDAAKTNLRLAVALQKGDLPLSRAYWLLGAHHLAADKRDGARKAFVEAIKYATAAEAKEFELLMRGYVYLIDIIENTGSTELIEELEFVKTELDSSRDGRFYKTQLDLSYKIFVENRSVSRQSSDDRSEQ